MKKTVLMVLLSVFALQMNAQINEPGRFYITPKVGYNMANITLFDKYGADPRHGINAGISGEYAVNERISIEPGVFYSMQGSTFKLGSVKLGLHTDYVTVPVLFKAYVAEGFNVFAGPQAGFLINSRLKLNSGIGILDDIVNTLSNRLDLAKYENKFDFAIVAGLGYQLPMGLSISANYNFGLTNVPKIEDVKLPWGEETYSLNINAKNTVLQVNIGYRF
jgi:hypothetical protein